MEYDKLPTKVKQLLNDIDLTRYKMKDVIDDALAKAGSPEELIRILGEKGLLDGVIGTLSNVLREFRDPMLIVTVEAHPCDGCEVVQNNLDADQHCPGCDNEAHLETFVPKDLRNRDLSYVDPTEASTESE